jgi:hypothetical protein
VNRGFYPPIQGVTDSSKSARFRGDTKDRIEIAEISAYSAAVTNFGFGFAADIMKSEMRGTISDLNREPLNTP